MKLKIRGNLKNENFNYFKLPEFYLPQIYLYETQTQLYGIRVTVIK